MTIYRVCGVYSSESHTEVYCVRLNFSTEIGLLTFDIVLLYIKQKKNGTLVFALLLKASNTKCANLTQLAILLYIELSNSFLIGQKCTVNF